MYIIQSNCVSETHKRGAYSLFWFLVPVATPKILSLQRTQSTSALIEWEALRLEDLRGNLTSYTIVYFALSNGCPSLTGSADSSSLSVVSLQTVFTLVDLLEPVHEYCAGVAATTGAGTGNFSYAPVSCEL